MTLKKNVAALLQTNSKTASNVSIVSFVIQQTPLPKARFKFRRAGNFVKTYTPAKSKAWEQIVMDAATEAMKQSEPMQGNLTASFTFGLPIPKSYSKKAHQACKTGMTAHTKKPDLDNLVKSMLDAMNDIVFLDDAQITRLIAGKHYVEQPYVSVLIQQGE